MREFEQKAAAVLLVVMATMAPLMVHEMVRADTTTQPAATEVEQLRAENARLQARVADLEKQLAARHGVPATRPVRGLSPIEQAIAEHRVVPGMTSEQANKAMGGEGLGIGPPQGIGHGLVQWKLGDIIWRAQVDNNVVTRVDSR